MACIICTDPTPAGWPRDQWRCGLAHRQARLCGGCAARLLARNCPLCRAPPTAAVARPLSAANGDFEPPRADREFVGFTARASAEAAATRAAVAALNRIRRAVAMFDEKPDLRRELNAWKPWWLPTLRSFDHGRVPPAALEELSVAALDMTDAIYFFVATPSEKQRWEKWAPMAERSAAVTHRVLADQLAPPARYEPDAPLPPRVQPASVSFYDHR